MAFAEEPIDAQRVRDYLDDQINEVKDLDAIESLIARVENQQALLEAQVCLGYARQDRADNN
jgi:hypothetical protein